MLQASLSAILVSMAALEGCPLALVGDPAQLAAQVRSAYARALGVELSTHSRCRWSISQRAPKLTSP